MKPPTRLPYNSRPIALPENIRLGWKCLSVTNVLSLNTSISITTVNFFIAQVTCEAGPRVTRSIRLGWNCFSSTNTLAYYPAVKKVL